MDSRVDDTRWNGEESNKYTISPSKTVAHSAFVIVIDIFYGAKWMDLRALVVWNREIGLQKWGHRSVVVAALRKRRWFAKFSNGYGHWL